MKNVSFTIFVLVLPLLLIQFPCFLSFEKEIDFCLKRKGEILRKKKEKKRKRNQLGRTEKGEEWRTIAGVHVGDTGRR